jgi:DNA-binding response OmpR family regulator
VKVLIIEDDADIRMLLRELLERNGYEVSEAEDGESGLRRFDQTLPEVVITDIVMPGREGISTIMELRKKKANTRIIAITGGKRASSVYLDLARKLGADKAFEKPLDLSLLLKAISELTAQRNEIG